MSYWYFMWYQHKSSWQGWPQNPWMCNVKHSFQHILWFYLKWKAQLLFLINIWWGLKWIWFAYTHKPNNNRDLITIYIYYYQVYAFTISRLSADAVRGGDPVSKSLLPLLPIICCWVANPWGTAWAPVFLGGGGRVGGLLGRAGGIFFSVTVADAEAIGAPIGASNKLSGVLRPVIKKVDNLKVLGYFVKLHSNSMWPRVHSTPWWETACKIWKNACWKQNLGTQDPWYNKITRHKMELLQENGSDSGLRREGKISALTWSYRCDWRWRSPWTISILIDLLIIHIIII